MYRVIILILSAQLAVAEWCECSSTFVTYDDLIANPNEPISVKYNRKTYTDMQDLIDDAIPPRLPVKPLTGIQIAMQQKPLSCNTINGGVSYDTSYDIPISVVYMTQSGPKVATYIFELQAICSATTSPSMYSFFLSAVKRHEGPIGVDSGDVSKFVPTSLVVDGPVRSPNDGGSDESQFNAGILELFKTCLPHGPLASYGECSSIKYGTAVRPTISVVSRPMLYMCMSISSWKDYDNDVDIDDIPDRAVFEVFIPGDHEIAIPSIVCGRSRVNYAAPISDSVLSDFIGATGFSYIQADSWPCDPEKILVKESTCEYGDISLSTNVVDFSGGGADEWNTVNSINGICTVPVASDCPRHKKSNVAKDYLAVIFIGVVSLLTLIAVVGVSVYGTYFYDPVKRVYKSNAIPKKPSPPSVAQPGDGLRQRQPSKAISFDRDLIPSDKIPQKPVEPPKTVEIPRVRETLKQAADASPKPDSVVAQKTLVASPHLLVKKDAQPSTGVTEKERGLPILEKPVLERPVRSEPVIAKQASVRDEPQRNVTPMHSIEESIKKARQLESRAEKVVPIGALKTVAGFIPEVAAAEKVFSKAEELREKAKPFVAKAEEISGKLKESKELSDKIKGIASRADLEDVISSTKVHKKIAPLIEKAASLSSNVEDIEKRAERKAEEVQKKAAPLAKKAVELATALSGKDSAAVINTAVAQNPLISHKSLLKSLVKHAGGEWNIANKS